MMDPIIVGLDIGSSNIYAFQIQEGGKAIHQRKACYTDSGDRSILNLVCFRDDEAFVGDHVGSKVLSFPSGIVKSFLSLLKDTSFKDLISYKDICFNEVRRENGCVYYCIRSLNEESATGTWIPPSVPMEFIMEYVEYLLFKKNYDLYADRYRIVQERRHCPVQFVLTMPDCYREREYRMVEEMLHWMHYEQCILVPSCVAILAEYGSLVEDDITVLFSNIGSHFGSLFVVSYSKGRAILRSVVNIGECNGDAITWKVMELLGGSEFKSLIKNDKAKQSLFSIAEKAKKDLQLQGISEVSVDMTPVFEKIREVEEEEEEGFVKRLTAREVDEGIHWCYEAYEKALREMSDYLHITNITVDRIVPIGGCMRMKQLRQRLLESVPYASSLTETVNMDECEGSGACLLGDMAWRGGMHLDNSLPFCRLPRGEASAGYSIELTEEARASFSSENSENSENSESELVMGQIKKDHERLMTELRGREERMRTLHASLCELEKRKDRMKQETTGGEELIEEVEEMIYRTRAITLTQADVDAMNRRMDAFAKIGKKRSYGMIWKVIMALLVLVGAGVLFYGLFYGLSGEGAKEESVVDAVVSVPKAGIPVMNAPKVEPVMNAPKVESVVSIPKAESVVSAPEVESEVESETQHCDEVAAPDKPSEEGTKISIPISSYVLLCILLILVSLCL